jgi:hypothetical protein
VRHTHRGSLAEDHTIISFDRNCVCFSKVFPVNSRVDQKFAFKGDCYSIYDCNFAIIAETPCRTNFPLGEVNILMYFKNIEVDVKTTSGVPLLT